MNSLSEKIVRSRSIVIDQINCPLNFFHFYKGQLSKSKITWPFITESIPVEKDRFNQCAMNKDIFQLKDQKCRNSIKITSMENNKFK